MSLLLITDEVIIDLFRSPTAEGNIVLQEPMRSKRSTKGAIPMWYGNMVTHKLVTPYS